ncbi:hypothetical protein F6V25_16390 [Oryzomonas japonica]|uniref:Uncharacterized protein n=1 Tax=Oryzomonas japonica TaxID=2603858 RepID=A0A7J4ZLT4_9BACT|nr:hypothetical protein [Oryzomonas japonica]KAB0663579.1 hypothetical protein F6V25_16390 [Oryzomonas japonica]
MDDIFKRRPFKVRNADEYDLDNVLNLFVSPIDGLTNPFDYENTIIKGRMGSGKTMYLRANHAYYLYGLVPNLTAENTELILPVLIRLSDFQQIREPSLVYRAVITKIIEELTSIYIHLQDAKKLAALHCGMKLFSADMLSTEKLSVTIRQLLKLDGDEYIERVTNELGLKGGIKHKFIEISKEWKETNFIEIKKKANPGIKDIEECYKNLLKDQEGKILLLIDEAGSLDKSFFQSDTGLPFFEILMNQFRTSSFIRTKIAVYPNTYSDMLTETRYGDVVRLEENVNNDVGYKRFHSRVMHLIHNYLNPKTHNETKYEPNDIFEVTENGIYGDCLEQLMYASNGNMRRLIHLLDMVMNTAYTENGKAVKISIEHAFDTLKQHADNTESLFSEQEKDFLGNVVSACKARGSFKFTFPHMSPILYKYTSKSQEYNIVNIDELGSGRKGTVYSFDYSYCVFKDIPTHYIEDTEKIHRDRTLNGGRWINRVAQINQQIIDQAILPGKIDGYFDYIQTDKRVGFIKCDSSEEYYFNDGQIIESDRNKPIMIGKRVRFFPSNVGDTKFATSIEVL